jgi:hypothetical protein
MSQNRHSMLHQSRRLPNFVIIFNFLFKILGFEGNRIEQTRSGCSFAIIDGSLREHWTHSRGNGIVKGTQFLWYNLLLISIEFWVLIGYLSMQIISSLKLPYLTPKIGQIKSCFLSPFNMNNKIRISKKKFKKLYR